MDYFVTLDDQEFALTLQRSTSGVTVRRTGEGATSPALDVEIVSLAERDRPAVVRVNGEVFRVLTSTGQHRASGLANRSRSARVNGLTVSLTLETQFERRARPIRNAATTHASQVTAPMPGRVVKVNVREGDRVEPGAALLSIEAMKMENELVSPTSARVAKVHVAAGATVDADQELILLELE